MHSTPLQINDRRLPITENLCSASVAMGDSPGFTNWWLWVDAICINQEDLWERSSQVRLMRLIYEGARNVLIWLGWPDDDVENDVAITKMRELHKIWHDLLKASHGDVMKALKTIPRHDTTIYDEPGSDCHQAWLGIASIMKRPWWRRTWIYQEASVPDPDNEKTWFFSGRRSMTWVLVAATDTIAQHLTMAWPGDASIAREFLYSNAGQVLSLCIRRERNTPL